MQLGSLQAGPASPEVRVLAETLLSRGAVVAA